MEKTKWIVQLWPAESAEWIVGSVLFNMMSFRKGRPDSLDFRYQANEMPKPRQDIVF